MKDNHLNNMLNEVELHFLLITYADVDEYVVADALMKYVLQCIFK